MQELKSRSGQSKNEADLNEFFMVFSAKDSMAGPFFVKEGKKKRATLVALP